MRILMSCSFPGIILHSIPLVNLMTSRGHEIDLFLHHPNGKSDYDTYLSLCRDPNNVHHISELDTSQTDIWMYENTPGNDKDDGFYTPYPYCAELEKFEKPIVCISFEDGIYFHTHRLTKRILDKTLIFLSPALHRDRAYYPTYQNRVLSVPAYITTSQEFEKVRIPLLEKRERVYFSGSTTGQPSSLTNHSEDEKSHRVLIANKIRERQDIDSLISFWSTEPKMQAIFDALPPELVKPSIGIGDYNENLNSSRISLALKGNAPYTRRFHESQAAGCVVFATNVQVDHEVYGYGKAGYDYVEIDVWGNDVVDKVIHYMSHDEDAILISNRGIENWTRYNRMENGLLGKEPSDHILNGIHEISGIML
jgi:hypothetical protein